jgi:hypothetical protein
LFTIGYKRLVEGGQGFLMGRIDGRVFDGRFFDGGWIDW